MNRRCRLLALSLVPIIALSALAEQPMIEQDVVRLVIAGRSSEEIVAEIDRRAVRFDVSDEMQDELELAGVPAEVIGAMVRRQRALDAERVAAERRAAPPVVEPAVPTLRVLLSDDGGSGELAIDRRVPGDLEARAGLPATDEPRLLEDLALFLVCRRAEHVPDQWRSHTPLGRDFLTMPRHRMLAFVAGATSAPRRLRLAIPPSIEAELVGDGPHDLSLGIAVRLDGRYYRLLDAPNDGVAVEATTTLRARVVGDRAGRPSSLEARWLDPPR